MVLTIGSAVRGKQPGSARMASVFCLSAVVGGGSLASAIVLLGQATTRAGLGTVALGASAAAALLLLAEGSVGHPARCGPRRQVPRRLYPNAPSNIAGIRWGLELGLGVATRINSWAFWAWALLVLSGTIHPAFAVVCGGCYGLFRGIQPIVEGALTPAGWGLTARVEHFAIRSTRFAGLLGGVTLVFIAREVAS